MLKKRGALLITCLLTALLGWAILSLFNRRFDRGDMYPPYSTLRSDPLGASVLFESLDRLTGVTPRRYYERTLKETEGEGKTLMVLGVSAYNFNSISRAEFNTLQEFLRSGGRVVIGYYPTITKSWSERKDEREAKEEARLRRAKKRGKGSKAKPAGKKEDENDSDDDEARILKSKLVDFTEEFGFNTTTKALTTNDDGKTIFPTAQRTDSADAMLPLELTLHSALYFSELTNGWTVPYERETLPVVIEREIGKGKLVLVADSYDFSNEAAFKNANTPLLAWLIGTSKEIVFDEAHLGIALNPGIATLMRKYRLHGLMLGLALLAILFIWKNSFSLVPPPSEPMLENRGSVILGKDANAGFVNLLRRSIALPEIINACHAEWGKNRGRDAGVSKAQQTQISALVQAENARPTMRKNPVATYRAISEVLRRKSGTPHQP